MKQSGSKDSLKLNQQPTVFAKNWIFVQPNSMIYRRPKKKNTTLQQSRRYKSQSVLLPPMQKESRPFFNSNLTFTLEEKQIMDRAAYGEVSDNLENIPLSYGGGSRLDVAKSMHRLSQINLLQEQIREEEEKRLHEEKKYSTVIDSENLFSQRDDNPFEQLSISNCIQEDEEVGPSFVTETEHDPYLLKENETTQKNFKESIQNTIMEKHSKRQLKIHTWNSCGGFNIMPEEPNPVHHTVKTLNGNSEYSILPVLKSLPDPMDQDTFITKRMREENKF